MLDQDSLPVVLICEENIIRKLPWLVTQRIVFFYVCTTAFLISFTTCVMQTTVFLCTFTGNAYKVISGANWILSYFSSRRVRRERRGWRRSSRLTRRSTWRKATCRGTWIKWWAFVSLRVHGAGVFWCRFNLFVFVCVSDYSGRAAHGADLRPGVSPQTEGKLPPETQRSAPQQRLATDSGPRQSGCTQRWVRQAWAFMRVVLSIESRIEKYWESIASRKKRHWDNQVCTGESAKSFLNMGFSFFFFSNRVHGGKKTLFFFQIW